MAVRRHRTLLGVAVLATALACLTLGAPTGSPAPRRALDEQGFPCGIVDGSTWSVPGGRQGTDWAVLGIDSNAVCTDKRAWARQLGADLMRVHNALNVGTERLRMSNVSYGCILPRAILLAICRQGNGGHGTPGVVIIANPRDNPYAVFALGPLAAQFLVALDHLPTQPPADYRFPDDSLVFTKGRDAVCATLTAPDFEVRRIDGSYAVAERGHTWDLLGVPGTCGVPGVKDLAGRVAAAAFHVSGEGGDDAVFIDGAGGWKCIVARQTRGSGHSEVVTGVPLAGCVRRAQAFGDTNPGSLLQFLVEPDVHQAGDWPSPGDLFTALASRSMTAIVTFARDLDHSGFLSAPTWECGSQDIATSQWRRGTGSTVKSTHWLMATSGGYPCGLAVPIFDQSLAHAAIQTGDVAHELSSWTCRANPALVLAMCTFDPTHESTLRQAFGLSTSPASAKPPLRVAIIGNYPGARDTLDRALTTGCCVSS